MPVPRQYTYKSQKVRLLVSLYDRVGALLLPARRVRATAPPRRISLVILNQIGDMVLALPSIAAVREMFPQAEVSVIAGRFPAELLAAAGLGVGIVPFNAQWQRVTRQFRNQSADRLPTGWPDFLRLIGERRPDVAVVFDPDLVLNHLSRLTRTRHWIGFDAAGAGFLLADALPLPETGRQSERLYALVERLGERYGVAVPAIRPPRLEVSADLRAKVAERLRGLGLEPGRLAVLHPFASAPTKNWNEAGWRAVAAGLRERGLQPVLIGGPHDRLDLPEVASLCGSLSLAETAALLSLARVFVGVDSGPGHIAAAAGCPVVSVFSSVNDPARWAPWGGKVEVLCVAPADRRRYPPELRQLPEGTDGNPYADGVTADAVLAAVSGILKA